MAASAVAPWHLDRIRVSEAWRETRGGGCVVSVVDDGVDVHHPEFADRIRTPFNAETGDSEAQPRAREAHGTKVAGLIGAMGEGLVGVAPSCSLMPVRLPSVRRLGSAPCERRAFTHAMENGADVICCAWGAASEQLGRTALPRATRDAIECVARQGRDGRGCVIVFAAGNEGAGIDDNPYAAHPDVIAVGACSRSDEHPGYSNTGDCLWCVFPSSDPADRAKIPSTAPTGSFVGGHDAWYTHDFGLTSAATAGVAGVCALVLSANPELTAMEVREILRDCCVKIDPENAGYDERGHSPLYGYGRVDAGRAVELALERRNVGNGRY